VACKNVFKAIKPPTVVFQKCQAIGNILVSSVYPPPRWTMVNRYPSFKNALPYPLPIINPSLRHHQYGIVVVYYCVIPQHFQKNS